MAEIAKESQSSSTPLRVGQKYGNDGAIIVTLGLTSTHPRNSPLHTVAIDHIAMPTANAERSIAFYKRLGFAINDETEGARAT